jgi:DNA-binding FrmR family transcriptional regulator
MQVRTSRKKSKAPKQRQAHDQPHDHSAQLKRLNRIKGQVLGVERMILEKRYCPEIIVQMKAMRSAIKSLEAQILKGHMHHCVTEAFRTQSRQVAQEKLDEILLLMKGND